MPAFQVTLENYSPAGGKGSAFILGQKIIYKLPHHFQLGAAAFMDLDPDTTLKSTVIICRHKDLNLCQFLFTVSILVYRLH